MTYRISLGGVCLEVLRQQSSLPLVAVWGQHDAPWTRGCPVTAWNSRAASCNSSWACCKRRARAGRSYFWSNRYWLGVYTQQWHTDVTDHLTWRATWQSCGIKRLYCVAGSAPRLPWIGPDQSSCQVWHWIQWLEQQFAIDVDPSWPKMPMKDCLSWRLGGYLAMYSPSWNYLVGFGQHWPFDLAVSCWS